MKKILLIACFIASLSLITGCNSDSFLLSQTEEISELQIQLQQSAVGLKSTILEIESVCEPTWIPLLHKNDLEVGSMIVSNNNTQLYIQILGNDEYEIENVQLWVGNKLSMIPANRNYQPQPGKFPYKLSGLKEYSFLVHQSQIGENYYFPEGKKLYILAHIEAFEVQSGEKKSVWSVGELLSSKSGATYTEYYPCVPTGGGGCFPHLAFCGQEVNEIFYFDNTLAGTQDIIADNKDTIGTVWYEDGKIVFALSQDWDFYGISPVESIYGYDTKGGASTEIDLGILQSESGNFYVSVPSYSYYVIKLNVQHCTTSN